MKNNTPEYFNHITTTDYGTCIDIDGLSEYSADGFELIRINEEFDFEIYNYKPIYYYKVEEGVRSINLIGSCCPQSITFPSTLEEIKDISVLQNCIYVENNSPNFVLENGCLYTTDKSELVLVFGKLVKNNDIIFDGVQKIRDYALANCNIYSSITIPSSVKDIGASAFISNRELKNITIPYGVEVIRESTFESTELTEINLPDTIVSIEAYAFRDCSSLESITLPKSLKQIDNLAFDGCDNIKSVMVNSPNFVLENGCLYTTDKSELVFVFGKLVKNNDIIFDGVQKIRDYALANCNNYSSITIPSSVKDIGASAFISNRELKNITIPYGVEVIRKSTFESTELTEINLPDTIVSIEAYAFRDCSSLESITLPISLRQIDNLAFDRCDNIKSVTVNSPHFILENGILYDLEKTKIFAVFKLLIGSEETLFNRDNIWKAVDIRHSRYNNYLFMNECHMDSADSGISGKDFTIDHIEEMDKDFGRMSIKSLQEKYGFKHLFLTAPTRHGALQEVVYVDPLLDTYYLTLTSAIYFLFPQATSLDDHLCDYSFSCYSIIENIDRRIRLSLRCIGSVFSTDNSYFLYKNAISYLLAARADLLDYIYHKEPTPFAKEDNNQKTFIAIKEVIIIEISDFYSSITTELLKSSIAPYCDDNASKIFQILELIGCRGLPVGSEASNILSEIVYTPFDKFMKSNKYIYYRYLDEITIFAPEGKSKDIIDAVSEILSKMNLTLDRSKITVTRVEDVVIDKHLDPYEITEQFDDMQWYLKKLTRTEETLSNTLYYAWSQLSATEKDFPDDFMNIAIQRSIYQLLDNPYLFVRRCNYIVDLWFYMTKETQLSIIKTLKTISKSNTNILNYGTNELCLKTMLKLEPCQLMSVGVERYSDMEPYTIILSNTEEILSKALKYAGHQSRDKRSKTVDDFMNMLIQKSINQLPDRPYLFVRRCDYIIALWDYLAKETRQAIFETIKSIPTTENNILNYGVNKLCLNKMLKLKL